MILPLHEQVRTRVREALARLHGISDPELAIPIEYPPNRTLGDLGTPVAFDLARRLRKAPRAIAQELAGALGPIPGVARVDAAPNGYLNVFLDRPAFLLSRLGLAGTLPPRRRRRKRPSSSTRRSIRTRRRTSATSATPRSATRSCACCGSAATPVEVQNYIDDTGVQVADVVVGFQHLEQHRPGGGPAHRRRRRASTTTAGISTRASPNGTTGDKERLKIRAATLHDIEHGVDPTAEHRRVHRRHASCARI